MPTLEVLRLPTQQFREIYRLRDPRPALIEILKRQNRPLPDTVVVEQMLPLS